MRPNILLIISDDHGMDDAGCYGNHAIKTPGMDALAKEGVRFTNAFCTASTCSPSRAVILTGLHTHANGQYGLAHVPHHFTSFEKTKTLPVMLAAAGYRTLNAGKFHTTPEPTYHFQQYLPDESPETMAEKCKPFITADDANPFFLCFCTREPHRVFATEGSSPVDPKDVIVPPYLPDIPECRKELAQYYMAVEREDKGILRLMEIVKQTGKWDNTIVIYISDNGIPFPGAKTNLYEPGIRLPCIVRNPAQSKQGLTSNAMITWADLTPTILDLAGATPAKAEFNGRSFRSILEETDPQGWDEVYGSHQHHEITMYYPMRMVRNRRYKLIWNIAHKLDYPFASDLYGSATWQAVLKCGIKTYGKRSVEAYVHRPAFELYDLQTDPWETKNLADDPKHADVLKDMKAKIKAFQEKTKDPWAHKWVYEY